MPEKTFDEDEIIYDWIIPPDHPDFTGHDDNPKAYRVVKNEKAQGGVIIYGKYRDEWQANPWNTRTLVKHFLDDIELLGHGCEGHRWYYTSNNDGSLKDQICSKCGLRVDPFIGQP